MILDHVHSAELRTSSVVTSRARCCSMTFYGMEHGISAVLEKAGLVLVVCSREESGLRAAALPSAVSKAAALTSDSSLLQMHASIRIQLLLNMHISPFTHAKPCPAWYVVGCHDFCGTWHIRRKQCGVWVLTGHARVSLLRVPPPKLALSWPVSTQSLACISCDLLMGT